ncbi:uncharacterized protein LOC126728520 [Quercus robur]|uniref:uncharacterized protein LOC126728520 n=1 Tax=Quercus robur TaxID=38942 RepID=UPI0021616ECD|nr:uncharacterized protein LOC126728520 [Quercus robur]
MCSGGRVGGGGGDGGRVGDSNSGVVDGGDGGIGGGRVGGGSSNDCSGGGRVGGNGGYGNISRETNRVIEREWSDVISSSSSSATAASSSAAEDGHVDKDGDSGREWSNVDGFRGRRDRQGF